MGFYKVPDWKKSIHQHTFEVEVEGETFHVIQAEYMTGEQVEKLNRATQDPAQLFEVLDEICEGLGTAMRPVPMRYLTEFLEAWQKDGAMGLGESQASTSSSKNTQTLSATTS